MLARTRSVFLLFAAACVTPAPAQPQADPRTMTTAELIRVLPAADTELAWDPALKQTIEQPAAEELRRRILARELSDQDWIAALTRTGAIHTRRRWPRHTPLAIGLICPSWLGGSGSITADAQIGGAAPAKTTATWGGCGLGNDSVRQHRTFITIGNLSPAATEVSFRMNIRASPAPMVPGREVAWSGQLSLPIELVDSLSDAIQGAHSADLDRAVRDAISVQVDRSQGTPPTVRMWIMLSPGKVGPRLDPTLSYALSLAIMDGDTVLQQQSAVLAPAPEGNPCGICVVMDPLPQAQLRDPAVVNRLTLRVTPDVATALRHDRYWDGELMLPVRDLLPAPTGRTQPGAPRNGGPGRP